MTQVPLSARVVLQLSGTVMTAVAAIWKTADDAETKDETQPTCRHRQSWTGLHN